MPWHQSGMGTWVVVFTLLDYWMFLFNCGSGFVFQARLRRAAVSQGRVPCPLSRMEWYLGILWKRNRCTVFGVSEPSYAHVLALFTNFDLTFSGGSFCLFKLRILGITAGPWGRWWCERGIHERRDNGCASRFFAVPMFVVSSSFPFFSRVESSSLFIDRDHD